jgi:hypothetical protein
VRWVYSEAYDLSKSSLGAPLNVKRWRRPPVGRPPRKVANRTVTMERHLVDTNVLARFFTGEPHEMAIKARRLVERADNGEMVLVVLPVIVAGLVYTLESVPRCLCSSNKCFFI